jgi:transketolase
MVGCGRREEDIRGGTVTQIFDDTDQLAVTTIRTLSIDAVEKANSGHPGAPMGLAPVAYVLFARFLKHDPRNPDWPDRDRFVLSCGHASALLYSVLHLMGYDLDLDQIKNFRQWGSKTPGHPEVDIPGAEMTTGPLGQGVAASVGMALAEAHMAATFNGAEHTVVNHRTWVLCSDGDLMEGVSSEAASLAGHLRLGKLTWIWDDNHITIEGGTELAVSDDIPARFAAHGWRVLEVDDANNLDALASTLEAATAGDDRPTLVRVRSHIAYGAPTKQDTAGAHGAPLGADEVRATKAAYGWPEDASFLIPEAVRERCQRVIRRGAETRQAWESAIARWAETEPALASEWQRRLERRFPEEWESSLPAFDEGGKIATRAASGKVLNAIAAALPELIGGSADLAPSNKTLIDAGGDLLAGSYSNRNIRFGIREHAMGAVLNGIALHGSLRPYGGTFLVFSDYMRPAIRLAALMEQPVVYVFTHDSVWVGEDGPTHQPVEHAMALRAVPGLVVLRPADAHETAFAWKAALERSQGPTALLLSRQGLPVLKGTRIHGKTGLPRGAYVLSGEDTRPPAIVLIATGGEVSLVVDAAARLADRGVVAQVVSMPSWELFAEQSEEYRRQVLLQSVPRLAVEAGVSFGWRDIVGDSGAVIGIDRFGASAPGAEVAAHLGLTVEAVVQKALQLVGKK